MCMQLCTCEYEDINCNNIFICTYVYLCKCGSIYLYICLHEYVIDICVYMCILFEYIYIKCVYLYLNYIHMFIF